MPSKRDMPENAEANVCQLIGHAAALREFATYTGVTQSQRHIKPLHWYTACRLVIEGGFLPQDMTPRPPIRAVKRKDQWLLDHDSSAATGSERTILGGLKTKNVDVVVTKEGIGPVMAVSCKGMTGAFRNLTNRMEETIGECTNLHITYPALVFGYLFVIRANRVGGDGSRTLAQNDLALQANDEPVESIFRFHTALRELAGRRGIRNDVSRYEAVALALVKPYGESAGDLISNFPPLDSPLRHEGFFEKLYRHYDERYVFSAPDLKTTTFRHQWSSTSPLFNHETFLRELGYEARLSS
jgi:hypothetical protein